MREQAVLNTDTSFEVIVDGDFIKRAAAGNILHVPMLTGTTANEGDIFVVEEEVLTFDFAVPGVTTAASNIITQVKVAISSYESDLIVSSSVYLHFSSKHFVYRSC